tara:strand:+ start:567 stop:1973 length:1407 start_codon:yes stop_codon:yes gene_type:complete
MLLSAEAAALFAAEAHVADAAVRTTGARHVRIAEAPLIVVPMTLAGEDAVPLAFAWGRDAEVPTVTVVAEPRDPDEARVALLALAATICEWLDPLGRIAARGREVADDFVVPQLVVPTGAAAVMMRKLAERMVRSPREADPRIRRAGGWLLFFLDRYELTPWDGSLVVTADVCREHWALPVSNAEGAHLLVVDACLANPGRAVAAAHEAEVEPGGTVTMPRFDADRLQPAIEAYGKASAKARDARGAAVHELMAPFVERSYQVTRRLLSRLREIPPATRGGSGQAASAGADFRRHFEYLDRGGWFGTADTLKRSVVLLADAEEQLRQHRQEARRADPILRAIAASDGEALDGEIVSSEVVMVLVTRKRSARVDLEILVEGSWRPRTGATLAVVWDFEKCPAFEVLRVAPERERTRVWVRTCSQHTAARSEVERALAPGRPISLVAEESSYQSFGLPAVPWMLGGEGRA